MQKAMQVVIDQKREEITKKMIDKGASIAK